MLRKLLISAAVGSSIGGLASCVLDWTLPPVECWCGEQWRVQIAGARAYGVTDLTAAIEASATSHTECVSMLEHLALNAAEPNDPIYEYLRAAFENQAIVNCEAAGVEIFGQYLSHTDCSTTGTGGSVTTNVVHLGACWVEEPSDNEVLCSLDNQCGEFYDCRNDPIIRYKGKVLEGGDTGGEEDSMSWQCDEQIN